MTRRTASSSSEDAGHSYALLRISELAEALSLSVDTLATYCDRYGMPFVTLPSGQRRFLVDEVRQWLRELQRKNK